MTNLHQAGKIDNLHHFCSVSGCVVKLSYWHALACAFYYCLWPLSSSFPVIERAAYRLLLGNFPTILILRFGWCSGQITRLSPLRFRVRSPVRFILMWTRTQSSCEKSIVNEVVGFLRVLRFPPTGKVDRWVRFEGH